MTLGELCDKLGRDTPILGELPITADGAIVGFGAPVYARTTDDTDRGRVEKGGGCWIGCFPTLNSTGSYAREMCECYSTREAALAAMKKEHA